MTSRARFALVVLALAAAFGSGYLLNHDGSGKDDPPLAGSPDGAGAGPEGATEERQLYADLEVPRPPMVRPGGTR